MRRALLVLPVLGLALTGCGHTSSSAVTACCPASPDATVTGVLVGVGGPVGAGVQHWAGTIQLRGRASSTVSTDDRGHFTVVLPPGVYRLRGTSPQYDEGRGSCAAPHPVRLRAHRTTHVRVVCQLR